MQGLVGKQNSVFTYQRHSDIIEFKTRVDLCKLGLLEVQLFMQILEITVSRSSQTIGTPRDL